MTDNDIESARKKSDILENMVKSHFHDEAILLDAIRVFKLQYPSLAVVEKYADTVHGYCLDIYSLAQELAGILDDGKTEEVQENA